MTCAYLLISMNPQIILLLFMDICNQQNTKASLFSSYLSWFLFLFSVGGGEGRGGSGLNPFSPFCPEAVAHSFAEQMSLNDALNNTSLACKRKEAIYKQSISIINIHKYFAYETLAIKMSSNNKAYRIGLIIVIE